MENYFEDNMLANEWMEDTFSRITWYMFKHQDRWAYMSGELGDGRNPMIRSEEEFDNMFHDAWSDATWWLYCFTRNEALKHYADNDIDFPHDLAKTYNEERGFEPGDDGYVRGRDF